MLHLLQQQLLDLEFEVLEDVVEQDLEVGVVPFILLVVCNTENTEQHEERILVAATQLISTFSLGTLLLTRTALLFIIQTVRTRTITQH